MATKLKTSKTKAADAKAPTAKSKPVPPAAPKPDYGVAYLAEQLGIQPLTVRNKLREAGVEKKGRSYDFTKKEADELVKQFKNAAKEEAKAEPKKPAPKAKSKAKAETEE